MVRDISDFYSTYIYIEYTTINISGPKNYLWSTMKDIFLTIIQPLYISEYIAS